ncbi:PAS domain-containing sensor histidine kinase [Geovibrio sp. ADMFC3]
MRLISGNRVLVSVSALSVVIIALIITGYVRIKRIEPDMGEFNRSRNLLRASSLISDGYSSYTKAYHLNDTVYLDKSVKSFDGALYLLEKTGDGADGCIVSVREGLGKYLGDVYNGSNLLTEIFSLELGRYVAFANKCLERSELSDWSGIMSYMTEIRREHVKADKLMTAFSLLIGFMLIFTMWLYFMNLGTLRKLKGERSYKYRLLDMLPNMVSVTDGSHMIACNKRVLEFVGYPSAAEFLKEHSCLCEFFIEESGYIFHRENDPWLTQVLNNEKQGLESKVKMRDAVTGKVKTLLINHSDFDTSEGTLAITFTDITEIDKMRLYLKESENRFRQLFNGHSAAMLLIDPVSKDICDANSAAVNFYGYGLHKLKSMRICDINIEDSVECRMNQAIKGECNYFEFRHRLADGNVKDVSVFSSPVHIDGKEYLFSIITDISDKKNIERELEQRTELLRAVLKNAPVWIWFVTPDGSLKIANDVFCRSTGIKESEVCGLRRYYEKMPSGFGKLTEDDMDTLLNSGFSVKEHEIRLADGKSHFLSVTKVRVKCPTGLNNGLVCIATDMTEQKKLENELRRINEYLSESVEKELAVRMGNEMKLKGVFNSINDAMLIFSIDKNGVPGKVIDVNNRLISLTGFSRHDVHNMRPDEIYEAQEFVAGMNISTLVSEGKHFVYESRLSTSSGGYITVEVSSSLVEINGTPVCIVSMRDIDSLIRLEKEKQDSETLTEATFNAAGIGICLCDFDGFFCKVNSTFASMHGYKPDELIGQRYEITIAEGYREQVHGEIKRFVNSTAEYFTSEHHAATSGGREMTVSVFISRIQLGGRTMFVSSSQDITELKRLEEIREVQEQMLIQQSKMAAMGEMIGVIAHQWKQPLNVVYILAQYLAELEEEQGIEQEKELAEISDGIMKQVEFMNDTMNDFRNFLKPGKEPQIFGVRQAVDEIVSMLLPQLRQSNIDVKVTCEEEYMVKGFKNEFKQVVMNIVSNARDAVTERRGEEAGKQLNGRIQLDIHKDDGNIALTICDNGGGISPDIMENIFKPYVSSKGDKGTGIGLSTAKTIIEEKMDGTITAFNTADGACFTVYLPEYGDTQIITH